jgi:AraC-like DNA-binding protein
MAVAPTSYYGNLLIVTEALKRSHGLDTDAMLEDVGVDLKAAAREDYRVPHSAVDRVWQLAVEATGDPCIGLHIVDDMNPAVYRSLGVALLCSSSLREFCQRFERFFAVISTLETVSFEEGREFAVLTDRREVEYSKDTIGCHADAFAAFVLKFVRLLYKPDYAFGKVQMGWTPPEEHQHRYAEFFGCPVEFGFDTTALFFDVRDLDQELLGANPDIALQNDKLALNILEKMRKLDLPTQVYARLIEYLPSGDCSRERVARSLNMSESAFQKKLKVAGTSYQELLDATRTELAKHYLGDTEMSVDEVAYMLGFSDCSNFTRAFKRWLAVSPREYRNSLSEATDN